MLGRKGGLSPFASGKILRGESLEMFPSISSPLISDGCSKPLGLREVEVSGLVLILILSRSTLFLGCMNRT